MKENCSFYSFAFSIDSVEKETKVTMNSSLSLRSFLFVQQQKTLLSITTEFDFFFSFREENFQLEQKIRINSSNQINSICDILTVSMFNCFLIGLSFFVNQPFKNSFFFLRQQFLQLNLPEEEEL